MTILQSLLRSASESALTKKVYGSGASAATVVA